MKGHVKLGRHRIFCSQNCKDLRLDTDNPFWHISDELDRLKLKNLDLTRVLSEKTKEIFLKQNVIETLEADKINMTVIFEDKLAQKNRRYTQDMESEILEMDRQLVSKFNEKSDELTCLSEERVNLLSQISSLTELLDSKTTQIKELQGDLDDLNSISRDIIATTIRTLENDNQIHVDEMSRLRLALKSCEHRADDYVFSSMDISVPGTILPTWLNFWAVATV